MERSASDDGYYGDDAATFGDRVAAAREAMGLDQPTLARRLGVKPQTVAAWEADRAEPRANRLQMLAGLLGVPMVWLMSGEGAGLAPAKPAARAQAVEQAIAELRALREAQIGLAERLGRLERRLRALSAPE
jgi:transcriptional regulator with XRE-family HTH domain